MSHIKIKAIPVEASQSMLVVERYHEPVRCALRMVQSESPNIDFASALQIAMKAINDTAGPDGLVPVFLVFGMLPRLGFHTDPPAQSIVQKSKAEQAAMV